MSNLSDEERRRLKAEYDKAYRIANSENIKAKDKARYLDTKDRRRAYNKVRYAENRDKIKAAVTARYVEKAEEIRAYAKEYRDSRPGYNQHFAAIHRANNRGLLPADLTEKEYAEMRRVYEEAARLQSEDGVVRHVDHIIPLAKGGLHRPSNLQILTAKENRAKGTSMPDENEKDL
jgi:5-methylcytosine-specific restriction endonuclease McrA